MWDQRGNPPNRNYLLRESLEVISKFGQYTQNDKAAS